MMESDRDVEDLRYQVSVGDVAVPVRWVESVGNLFSPGNGQEGLPW